MIDASKVILFNGRIMMESDLIRHCNVIVRDMTTQASFWMKVRMISRISYLIAFALRIRSIIV